MVTELSRAGMLALWRRNALVEPSADSCSVELFDGLKVDELLEERMRAWYLAMLDRGDPAVVTDAAELFSVDETISGVWRRIKVDSAVRRVLSLRLAGWEQAVTVVRDDRAAELVAASANPYLRPTAATPAAVIMADGALYASPVTEPFIVSATATVDTGSELYRLDESALATIPTIFTNELLTQNPFR